MGARRGASRQHDRRGGTDDAKQRLDRDLHAEHGDFFKNLKLKRKGELCARAVPAVVIQRYMRRIAVKISTSWEKYAALQASLETNYTAAELTELVDDAIRRAGVTLAYLDYSILRFVIPTNKTYHSTIHCVWQGVLSLNVLHQVFISSGASVEIHHGTEWCNAELGLQSVTCYPCVLDVIATVKDVCHSTADAGWLSCCAGWPTITNI